METGDKMAERKDVVTFKGNPLTLLGNELKVGDTAPDAEVLANDLSPVKLSDFLGKVCVICAVPSLDTPVCDIQTRKFNEQAASMGDDVVVLTISMDLPFAQKRWCGSANVENVQTLSDHLRAEFGTGFGVLIKELRLLARTVFIVDKEGIIRYIQIVKELTSEPDYEAALTAVKEAEK
jgi:thiol peroxidase